MAEYSLIIAGLSTVLFDRLRKEADSKIAPGGKLFLSPNSWSGGYDPKHAGRLLEQVHAFYLSRPEGHPIKTLLLYADYGNESTQDFLENFFPFALPFRMELPELRSANNKSEINKLLNEFAASVVAASRHLRAISGQVSRRTHVHNLNPLLLPVRNFAGSELSVLLRRVFDNAAYVQDPEEFLGVEIEKFLLKHPWKTPPDAQKRALSDGVLFFKSPGNDRHGYLRNGVAKKHPVDCLLNARSRLGGSYDYCLHYDCTPVKGKLKAVYENCHGHDSPPKKKHVNIAPNDFII